MARDTDRREISEAFRLASRRLRHDWKQVWESPTELTAYDTLGHELNLTYSLKGRLTKAVHWDVTGQRHGLASRKVIETSKRQYVLKVINGG